MKLFKISIAVLVLTIACFAASYGSAVMAGLHTDEFYPVGLVREYMKQSGEFKEVNLEKSVDAEGITAATVVTDSMDITVVRSANEKITVHMTGMTPKDEPDDEGLKFEAKDGSLTIATPDTFVDKGLRINLRSDEFEPGIVISLPAKFGRLSLKSKSGDIHIDPIVVSDLSIDAGSGEVMADRGLEGGDLRVKSSSGDIMLAVTRANKVSVFTSAGDVSVYFDETAPVGSIESSSGDVRVYFPRNPDVKLLAESSSGELELEESLGAGAFGGGKRLGLTLGKGTGSVSVETGSGDVRIGSGR